MILAEDWWNDKGDRALAEWVQDESARVANKILQRIPPAVRQAMTTLEAIETGTQTLMQNMGRRMTEVLMGAQCARVANIGPHRGCPRQPFMAGEDGCPRALLVRRLSAIIMPTIPPHRSGNLR